MSQDNTSTITSDTSSEVVLVKSQAQARTQQAQRGGIQEATLEELVTMIEQGKDSNGRPWLTSTSLPFKQEWDAGEDVRKQIKVSGLTALPTIRTEMVFLAQRMWEGLRQDGKRSTYRSSAPQKLGPRTTLLQLRQARAFPKCLPGAE